MKARSSITTECLKFLKNWDYEKSFYSGGFFLLGCLSLFLRLIGQDNLIENGYNKIYYPNGKISSEGLMRNGKPDGFWKTYYPSGIISLKETEQNHLLDSIWVFYNESGDTLQKVSYSWVREMDIPLQLLSISWCMIL